MTIQNVSFGKVYAVTGTHKQADSLRTGLAPQIAKGNTMLIDVTSAFYHSYSEGVLGSAAKVGDCAMVCITGADVKKVETKQKGWDSIDNILLHISDYVDLKKKSNITKAIKLLV